MKRERTRLITRAVKIMTLSAKCEIPLEEYDSDVLPNVKKWIELEADYCPCCSGKASCLVTPALDKFCILCDNCGVQTPYYAIKDWKKMLGSWNKRKTALKSFPDKDTCIGLIYKLCQTKSISSKRDICFKSEYVLQKAKSCGGCYRCQLLLGLAEIDVLKAKKEIEGALYRLRVDTIKRDQITGLIVNSDMAFILIEESEVKKDEVSKETSHN